MCACEMAQLRTDPSCPEDKLPEDNLPEDKLPEEAWRGILWSERCCFEALWSCRPILSQKMGQNCAGSSA